MTRHVVAAVVVAVATGLAALPVLRALPVPAGEEASPYRRLARPRFAAGVAATSLAAGLLVAWRLPGQLAAWVGLLSTGVLGAWIDAHTLYLPRRLAHAGWAMSGLGVLLLAPAGPGAAIRAVAGAAAAFALGWLAWRLLRFGFGDARLLAITGCATAAHSWGLWFTGLLAATTAGALMGVVTALRRGRDGAFPYGPAIALGPFLALLLA